MSYFDTISMVPSGTRALPMMVGGYPPQLSGVTLLAPVPCGKGVVDVVSFDELFQFCLVLIGFAGLIIQIVKKK